jgi:hypothetical protein
VQRVPGLQQMEIQIQNYKGVNMNIIIPIICEDCYFYTKENSRGFECCELFGEVLNMGKCEKCKNMEIVNIQYNGIKNGLSN